MDILVINPGGSSTKIAVFSAENKPRMDTKRHEFGLRQIFGSTIRHSVKELIKFKSIFDQIDYRKSLILKAIGNRNYDAIVTRGGPLKPLQSGTYQITKQVVDDIKKGKVQSMHPSLLGPLIAYEMAEERSNMKPLITPIIRMIKNQNKNRLNPSNPWFKKYKRTVPAFFVDPESVDEFSPLARISGLPEIPRKSLSHFLNTNAVVRKAVEKLGKKVNQCNFIITHLGSGITVAAKHKGKQIDANNANEDGPFSPQRSGSLPLQGVIDMCFSGKYTRKEMLDKIQRKGGLLAYLGTDDIREIEKRIKNGDHTPFDKLNKDKTKTDNLSISEPDKRCGAELIYNAMIYQIAKEIGAMFVALKGKVTAIIITGGIAYQKQLVNKLKLWIKFMKKPILIFPGEEEMTALAQGALRIMSGIEKEQQY